MKIMRQVAHKVQMLGSDCEKQKHKQNVSKMPFWCKRLENCQSPVKMFLFLATVQPQSKYPLLSLLGEGGRAMGVSKRGGNDPSGLLYTLS